MKDPHETVYVVIRVDHFPGLDASDEHESNGPVGRFGEFVVNVKEVVTTAEEADREVERLNALNADKGSRYFWAGGHYFPGGGSHGSRAV